jgi:hypothetical protein
MYLEVGSLIEAIELEARKVLRLVFEGGGADLATMFEDGSNREGVVVDVDKQFEFDVDGLQW